MRRAWNVATSVPHSQKVRCRLYCVFETLAAAFGIAQNVNALSYVDPSGSIGLGSGNLREIVTRLIGLALGLLGLVAVIMMLWGGFRWLLSGGNEESVAKAKATIASAIIGMIIILLAWAIVRFVITTTINVSSVAEGVFAVH